VSDDQHPIHLSPEGLQRIVELRLSGAPLATLLALLSRLDSSGHARVTQPELCRLLGTGAGRVWQSLQALVAAGVILPPDRRGTGRGRAPYRIAEAIAVAPTVPVQRPWRPRVLPPA
jgi:hypothetical protein